MDTFQSRNLTFVGVEGINTSLNLKSLKLQLWFEKVKYLVLNKLSLALEPADTPNPSSS